MKLNDRTLEKLRILINEESKYRTGPELVNFFNQLGFNDIYGKGFPSRSNYTDDKLGKINGTPEIDKCIKKLFSPIEYLDDINGLNKFINDFNKYLSFDGWIVEIQNQEVIFKKKDTINWFEENSKSKKINNEQQLLTDDIPLINIDKLRIDNQLKEILNERINEIKKSLTVNNTLSIIFLAGSSLEGILLSYANSNKIAFNKSQSAPKYKDGKVKKIYDWKLSELIDVSYSIGLVKEDVKKFSHVLRDFRNFIHPYEQRQRNFSPDMNTAKICYQVLKLTMLQLKENDSIINPQNSKGVI